MANGPEVPAFTASTANIGRSAHKPLRAGSVCSGDFGIASDKIIRCRRNQRQIRRRILHTPVWNFLQNVGSQRISGVLRKIVENQRQVTFERKTAEPLDQSVGRSVRKIKRRQRGDKIRARLLRFVCGFQTLEKCGFAKMKNKRPLPRLATDAQQFQLFVGCQREKFAGGSVHQQIVHTAFGQPVQMRKIRPEIDGLIVAEGCRNRDHQPVQFKISFIHGKIC